MGNQLSIGRQQPSVVEGEHAPSTDAQPRTPAPSPARPARAATGSSFLQGLQDLWTPRPVPDLPPELWTAIAGRSKPLAVQRLRAVSKPLKAAVEADMRQLVIRDRAGLAGAKRAGNYPALEKLTLIGPFTDNDLRGCPHL